MQMIVIDNQKIDAKEMWVWRKVIQALERGVAAHGGVK